MPALTIGVIHHGRLKSLAATIKALQRDHDLSDVELLVMDTQPTRKAKKWVKHRGGIRYAANTPAQKPSALDQVFDLARGDVVLVLQDPVRLRQGALRALRNYFERHPESRELVHGPLMSGTRVVATHSNPYWRRNTWGIWSSDLRGRLTEGEAFAIPMQESGVFSCKRRAWPGMPPLWRGYGGEAGFLQDRFRRDGAQIVCLPGLQWERLAPVKPVIPRSPAATNVLRNHLAGAASLDLDTHYITLRHRDHVEAGEPERLRKQVLRKREKENESGMPKVSCLLHAGRLVPAQQRLLEESIESFLRQGYRNKELIVLNDIPEQTLVCEAPGVRIVNTSAQCPSLGDCYNAAIAFAAGDVFAPWGATSINLPWRLEFSVRMLEDREVFRPAECWYMLDGELDSRPGQPDGGQVALFTREALRSVGGFPSVTLGLHRAMDAALDQWLTDRGARHIDFPLPQADWFTILRRRQADAGYQGDPFLDPWQAQGQLPVNRGRFVLKPHWRRDYVAMCVDHVSVDCVDHLPTAVPVPFVLGSGKRKSAFHFPRLDQARGEAVEHHLERVVALLSAAVDAGGTHLVIPRSEAGWLSDHEHVAEYLTSGHWLADANAESGFIFALSDSSLDLSGHVDADSD